MDVILYYVKSFLKLQNKHISFCGFTMCIINTLTIKILYFVPKYYIIFVVVNTMFDRDDKMLDTLKSGTVMSAGSTG